MNLHTFEYGTEILDSSSPDFVWVDENIAPIVSSLNKKGYITVKSNEGHIERTLDDSNPFAIISIPYISFASTVKLPQAPEGWTLEDEPVDPFNPDSTELQTNMVVDMNYHSGGELEFYKKKLAALFTLAAWVENLPSCV